MTEVTRRRLVPKLDVHMGLLLACFAITGGASCRKKEAPPPPPPQKLGPEERIMQVGKAWREMSQTEGYVNEVDVAFIRVNDQLTLHIKPSSRTALVDVDRTELIRTPDGHEYHCKVEGAVRAAVRYEWRMEEASVSVRMPSANLPRACRERGFARPFKQIPDLVATYVLRGDQLVAVEPITLRSVLLPVD